MELELPSCRFKMIPSPCLLFLDPRRSIKEKVCMEIAFSIHPIKSSSPFPLLQSLECFKSGVSRIERLEVGVKCNIYPVKNVTGIVSCLFDGSQVENEAKSDGNPVIFSAIAMEIPSLELVQNPCHVPAWTTNMTSIIDMESSWNLRIFRPNCRGIFMRIHVMFFTGKSLNLNVNFISISETLSQLQV